MGSLSILRAALSKLRLREQPRRILELGAGDGTLLLRLARALRPAWTGVELTLLDRHELVSAGDREGFGKLGWRVTILCADVLEWVRAPHALPYDLCFANLFLHHFDGPQLAALLQGVACRTNALIACEPRRSDVARIGSRLIAVLGANAVTREDAVKSVTAGFTRRELSCAWLGAPGDWVTSEYAAWPFSHCFLAARRSVLRSKGSDAL